MPLLRWLCSESVGGAGFDESMFRSFGRHGQNVSFDEFDTLIGFENAELSEAME
jgi:hypothetical protein